MKFLVVLAIVVAACVAYRTASPPAGITLKPSSFCDDWQEHPELYRLVFNGAEWECVPKYGLLADTEACRAMAAALDDYELRWNGEAYDCVHLYDVVVAGGCELDIRINAPVVYVTHGNKVFCFRAHQFEGTGSETLRGESCSEPGRVWNGEKFVCA